MKILFHICQVASKNKTWFMLKLILKVQAFLKCIAKQENKFMIYLGVTVVMSFGFTVKIKEGKIKFNLLN